MKSDRPLNTRLQAVAALATLVLAACGGGGSGDAAEPAPSPAPAPTPAPAPAPTPAPPPPPTALELATKFLASYDQSIATTPPATGAERIAPLDKCFLHNGASSSFLAASYEETGAAAAASTYSQDFFARDLGSKRSNVQVLSDRATTNADGSPRREIDVQYDVTYADGTVDVGGQQTLITGSSSGSCATPDSKSELRFFGNRKKVYTNVVSRNLENVLYKLSDGSPQSPSVSYKREVRFQLRDPGNIATYMIVSGPGLKGPSGQPFSLKMLSPRILRDALEMQGKPTSGNYIDTDGFQLCYTPASADANPTADIADCVGAGASTDSIGRNLNSPFTADRIAGVDGRFEADGWVAGGVYTIAVYADDGWKTINGQQGKTPIATYTDTLPALPYSFAQMLLAPAAYPSITGSSLTFPQIAQAAKTTGGVTQLTWKKAEPPTGGKPLALLSANAFSDGVKSGSATGYPRVRELVFFFPGLNQLTATVPFTGKNPATDAKRFLSFTLYYGDRNGRVIQHTTQIF